MASKSGSARAAVGAVLLIGALAAPPFAAAQVPPRKQGLWIIDMTGGPGGAMHMATQSCSDPARERSETLFSGARNQANCEKGQVGPAPGGGFSFHMVCKPTPDMTTDTSGTATGDFQSGYVVRTTTRMTPAPIPSMATMSMTMTARYAGPCPVDMKPGDARVNGRVMHAPAG